MKTPWHSESRIERALELFDAHIRGKRQQVIDTVFDGLTQSQVLAADCKPLNPITAEALHRRAALQIVVDLVEFVLPRIGAQANPAKAVGREVRYEILEVASRRFVRWFVKDPARYLVDSLDQFELASEELGEEQVVFDVEVVLEPHIRKYLDDKFRAAGLERPEQGSDLTPEHVIVMGAVMGYDGYHIIPGQEIPRTIRAINDAQWSRALRKSTKKDLERAAAERRTKISTRGFGFDVARLVDLARRETRDEVKQLGREQAAARRAVREQQEQERAARRAEAKRLREVAAQEQAAEVKRREEVQRAALAKKSARDREQWQAARTRMVEARARVDVLNRELLREHKRLRKSRQRERAAARTARLAAEDAAEREALEQHLRGLPADLRDGDVGAFVRALIRDREAEQPDGEPDEEAIALARRADEQLSSAPFAQAVDPDLRSLVRTWLRRALEYDGWIEHVEERDRHARTQLAELRRREAEERSQRAAESVEEAKSKELARAPGTSWSQTLRFLDALDTDERIARLEAQGFVGPLTGFEVLRRHLHGETTEREQREHGRTRWVDLGSAYSELSTLERLSHYRVSVRFTRELPGKYNPDFLVIDTLEGMASEARIRPLEVKKIYLDRATTEASALEVATEQFTQKLAKAGKQLAEGVRRYGAFGASGSSKDLQRSSGGTAYFILQDRAPEGDDPTRLERYCTAFEEQILAADREHAIDAVDCVIAYLDHVVAGELWQRPILALARDAMSATGWGREDAYIDHLTSVHDVRRRIGPSR